MFDRSGRRKYLNWPERAAFLHAVRRETNPGKRTFCLTLFYTGCRISEALNLSRERVDFTGQALVFETLKRRKRGQFRAVPIPSCLLAEIKGLETSAAPDGLVWPVSRPTAYRWVKAAMKAAKIGGTQATPKGLRHSYAIACISRAVPLPVVQRWLGHARLETTAIYLNVMGEEERALARRLWRKE
jgi:integrase